MAALTPSRASFDSAKSSDHSGAGASYATLGGTFNFPSFIMIITSSFDMSVWLSMDGSTDQILVLPTSSLTIDLSGTKLAKVKVSFALGTQFYLKQGPDGAPTTGDISISTIYAG